MTHARSLVHFFDPDGETYKPTVHPSTSFSATADAEYLKKSMVGLGTEENLIVEILGRRTCYERMAISKAYPVVSKKTLSEALTSELSGEFRNLSLMLVQSPWEVMAEALYKAMKGVGTKERVLNEVLSGCLSSDIPELKAAYERVSGGGTLEDAIKSDTSGDYRAALLLVLAGQGDEPPMAQLRTLSPITLNQFVDENLAANDAKELYNCGEGRLGTHEHRFMRPIINRTPWQLGATNAVYLKVHGHSLSDAIREETSGDLRNLLLSRLRYAIDRAAMFAELIHYAISGPGTLDGTLQRTLALRADIDLGSVKEKYMELFGESMEDAIKGDTSKDYRALCLKLLGPS